MNTGKLFEQDFKNSIPKEVYYYRLKDPAQSFGNQDNNLRFSLPNPYDIILFYNGILFTLELKSTIGTAFSFTGKTPMIKKHQIEELTKASEYKGIIAGFVFHMDKYKTTYFLEINKFNEFIKSTEKKSINQQDILDNGSIEIIGKIKKVRTKYFIEDFVDKFVS